MAVTDRGLIGQMLGFWRMTQGVILSPLPLETCRRRIAAETNGPLVLFGPRPLQGLVGSNWARLRKNRRLNNSFQTILVLSMESTRTETRILWRCGASTMARLFLAAWLTGIVVVLFLGLASGLLDLFFLGPAAVIMLGVGVGLAVFGRRMARGEDLFLVQTVTRLVEGKPQL